MPDSTQVPALRAALLISLLLGLTSSAENGPVTVENFEKPDMRPTVWVVNIPDGNASVSLLPKQGYEGGTGLELRYKFTETGGFQYLGVPKKTRIHAPVQQLRFRMKGDGSMCSYGLQLTDSNGETHQFGKNSGEGGLIDFSDWKEIVFNLDRGHETWGGDKNGKMDYPLTAITLTIGQPTESDKGKAAEGALIFDSLMVNSGKSAAETLGAQISVISPGYGDEVSGKTEVRLSAPGFSNVSVKCWQQGEGGGSDSIVATVSLDAEGAGSFVFPADSYPRGPVTLRISGEIGDVKDNCYLQLYNKGGISWREGIPKNAPPAAEGMTLVFADDFNGPLSISSKDGKATYYDHKPPNGAQDFSTLRFTGYEDSGNPFLQTDTYLRIRASEKSNSSGIISSMKNDGTGITAKAPCYFECRFIGPNAVGTWPAFWLMTDYMTDHLKGRQVPCDELDIIEAYGGEGAGSPNAYDTYMVMPHAWEQGEAGKAVEGKAVETVNNPVRMKARGISSAWFESLHTYGCKITEKETIYYCDDVEVARHETMPLSKTQPFFFLFNLATGGGWPVDLSRYNGVADMYVDYVRVYQGENR